VGWLYFKVLRPLNRTLKGFSEVSQGNFGLRVNEQGSQEIKQLTHAFNHLSDRLKVLFELIDRLQQGSDLDQTLGFLSREFQTLLRIDWIGALFITADRNNIKLESAYLDGTKEPIGQPVFSLTGTLLEKAMGQEQPLHMADMANAARENTSFAFLQTLVNQGMSDAIFLPLGPASQSPVPGVLVFATRTEHSYDPEHLILLNNIAQLVTHSFGRTVKLARHAHLAAVGQFASGIAHEVRTPLATVGMALEHLSKFGLPENSEKRVRLATSEVDRMSRLLEDMLLYAKPVKMRLQNVELDRWLRDQKELQHPLAAANRQTIRLESGDTPIRLRADPDRLSQILTNLTRNACEASPNGATIYWHLRDRPKTGTVELVVRNLGPAINPEALPQLCEPFFTTKTSGTGLGLAIVSRLVDAHGGDLTISSDDKTGTQVTVAIPRLSIDQ